MKFPAILNVLVYAK